MKPSATHLTFGYPDTLVHQYRHWTVQVRPAQLTLGALVLVATEDARSFAGLSEQAFTELAQVTKDAETALKAFSAWQKINYLMFMMVDPDVHFHVLPRYEGTRTFQGIDFPDRSWPTAPDLGLATRPPLDAIKAIAAHLESIWPS